VVARLARGLLAELDVTGGVRLLGVGVSGLADWIQDDLFADQHSDDPEEEAVEALPDLPDHRTWVAGMDVEHTELGRGWVWGAGRGIVTVRFETAETPPGPVRSLPADDPRLSPWRPG
jgi:DNA polymerase-4